MGNNKAKVIEQLRRVADQLENEHTEVTTSPLNYQITISVVTGYKPSDSALRIGRAVADTMEQAFEAARYQVYINKQSILDWDRSREKHDDGVENEPFDEVMRAIRV